ncbi:MAG: hypothetical protein M0P91_09690 [Sulfuricurvum sp.]|jgi:hypothetical protein|uniref:hypothetical protein n=1 Tax=Sulfuricurvum sp. TaxID=2025608 RepID=UPI0025D2E7CD|nr:hypothetical protein [Sulfuricurvum sp.]MCK9373460.1 hypothetical protein [Sulfuricurvum sp.]
MSVIAKQTVTNMAEDATMMVGYSLVNTWITEKLTELYPDTQDENGRVRVNYAREILAGGASFLFMSAMMEVIKREEKFVEYVFAAGEAVISVLYLRNKGAFDRIGKRIKSMKGVKALNRLKLFDSQTDVTNSFIGQVYQAMQTILNGRNTGHDVANTISASNSSMDTAIRREGHDLRFASMQNKSFADSLMIKTLTGTYSESDKLILQKIIGRDNFNAVPIEISELNKLHEFIYTKDSNGKLIGIARTFTDLTNALGFFRP